MPSGEPRRAQLDGWIWEDEEEGVRVTGARSASWDTGFALQALAALPEPVGGAGEALRHGAGFLLGQRIDRSFEGFREAWRIDPKGGWCFAGGWHGWPVSDCTAEAVLGIIATGGTDRAVLGDAVAFMLRTQNRDGGFGGYEACRDRFPEIADGAVVDAFSRAESWLRRTQEVDGSWRGVWGVQFIYGTLCGVRGLLAAGVRLGDPALRSACRWLLERQREDGGWGEHHSGCLTGRYVPHEESQIIQTAWAPDRAPRGGRLGLGRDFPGRPFLLDAQDAEGGWPKQDMAGVFFQTALLDYVLYRQYFPLHAPGLYERRRRSRTALAAPAGASASPLPEAVSARSPS